MSSRAMLYWGKIVWASPLYFGNYCIGDQQRLRLAGVSAPNLLVSSADNLYKQFGPRSGPTKCQAWSGSKLFDALIVFLKEFFEKVDFEKNHQTTKKREKISHGNLINWTFTWDFSAYCINEQSMLWQVWAALTAHIYQMMEVE